jgi:hypothetical protein
MENIKTFNPSDAGATFAALPACLQEKITKNLQPSAALLESIENGTNSIYGIFDEWKTQCVNTKERRTVLKKWNGTRLVYTVKSGNKILVKDGTAANAANQIALYYKKYLC